MGKIIQVQTGEYRPVLGYEVNNVECDRDDIVILEVDRGSEFGRVVTSKKNVCGDNKDPVKGKILRKATDGDLVQLEHNRIKAKEAMGTCLRKISDCRLEMSVVKAEYTFDSSKIIFYFTADGRVDFRHLVKELARIFRVRIELKQIGVRDKAKIISGYGVCGRELCCSSYMKGFHALSIKMVKQQGLPLNPSRISGVCGRIKCCMAYEFETYKYNAKGMPNVGEKIETGEGKGRVIELNILKKYAWVELGDGRTAKVGFGEKSEP